MRKNKVCKIFSVVMILVSALVCPISSNAYSFLKTADGSADISGLKDSYIVFQSWNGFTQETRWAIDYASRQWNNRTGYTKLYHSATQHSEENKYPVQDGRNLITKVSNIVNTTGNVTLMRTYYYYDLYGTKYQIYESDIVINNSVPWRNNGSANGYDVQNVMTHEFGHMLGLGHSEFTEATMYESSSMGEIKKRDLHQDDLNGFNALY